MSWHLEIWGLKSLGRSFISTCPFAEFLFVFCYSWQKAGNCRFGFVFVHTNTHSRSWPQGIWVPPSGYCKVTYLLGFIIRTVVWLRLLTGVKEQRLPSLPVITLLSPSTSADSQWVLFFSSQHRLLRDKSLAELNRHTCVTPGYRLPSLISS